MPDTALPITEPIDHAHRSHALLSASGAHRWMNCPPSALLADKIEDQPTVFAEEGTFLHELCELKLHKYLQDLDPAILETEYREHMDNEFYTEEAEEATDEYVSFCVEIIEAVRASCPDPLILVEHKLDYSEYVPGGFGTGDMLIVGDGVLEIIDFKGGRGVRVEAERNPQLMLYALAGLLEFDPLYDIHTIRMSIVQPRLHNTSSYEITPEDLLHWAETEVAPKAALAIAGKGEFKAGEHCRFCKARFTCRARSEYYMSLARKDFKEADLLTDEEIADILPVAQNLTKWVEDLVSYATAQAVKGKTWPGYKLVASQTKRKYTSDADVIRVCTEAGYTNIYKTTLLGISDLEKAIGRKAFKEIVSPYVFKPEGKPELAPLSDKREPISNAAEDFSSDD